MNTIANLKIINILLVVSLLMNIYMFCFPNTHVVVDDSYKQELAQLNDNINSYKQQVKEIRKQYAQLEVKYAQQDSINTRLYASLNNLSYQFKKKEDELLKKVKRITRDGVYNDVILGTKLQQELDSIATRDDPNI